MIAEGTVDTHRLKHVVELQRIRAADVIDGPYVGLENIESWTGRLTGTADTRTTSEDTGDGGVGQSQSNSFQPGDILFGKLRPYLAKAWVAEFTGRCTTEALVMRAERIEPRFLLYVLLQPSFINAVDSSTYGSKMPRAEWDFIGSIPIPVPPRSAQRAIIDFLDAEVGEVDALVAAKQRLIDLLAEKRKAILATAVTRGLDTKVKLRASSVPWLGEVPAHWEHRNLRFCCTAIQTGGTPAPEFLDYDGDDGLDWLTPGDFGESLVPQRSTRRVAPGALSAGDLKMFPVGTVLVVGIGATLGKVGVLPHPASANQQVNALIPRADVDTLFLAYEMSVLAELLRVSANTATLPILNQQRMGDLPVLVPPLDEQQTIVEHIARQTAQLDAVRAATERTIALLKERRAALIAAAVTGQLDVGAAA